MLRYLCLGLLWSLPAACVSFQPLEKPPARGAADASAAVAPRLEPDRHMIGSSVAGEPIRIATVGTGPRRVLWIGGIHGDEREGSVATAELPAALAAVPGALEAVTLTILDDVNPDGTAAGTRGNKNGVDLNRNYPAANFKPHRMYGIRPLSQPEARALHDLVLSLQPHLVIVAHSWRGDRFINFDGPAEPLAERFRRLSTYPLRKSADIAPTPGSLGSWVGKTLGIPILTIEYRRGSDPTRAWQETKAAILAVVVDA
jgi:predicted deacylase